MTMLRTATLARPRRLGSYSLLAYVFLALFVLSVIGATGYSITRDRAALEDMHTQRATGNAQVFEDQISQTLQLIDNMIGTLPETSDVPLSQSEPEELHRLLSRLLHSQPAVRSLSIVTLQGNVRASSNAANIGKQLNLKDFLPLDTQNSDTRVLRIGRVWLGRDLSDGRPVTPQEMGEWDQIYFVPLALRLGNMADPVWVIAALNPDYLIGRHSRYSQSATDHFELVRLDGSVLVTTQEEPLGKAFGPASLLELAQRDEFGVDQGKLIANRLTAFRHSARYPFFVAVHINQADALSAWLQRAQIIALGTLLALTVVVAATLAMMRRIQKNELAKKEHRRTIHTLSQAIEQNPGAVLITNTRGEIEYCNRFFTRMSGFKESDVKGRSPHALDAGKTSTRAYEEIVSELNAGNRWSGEFLLRHRDGHEYTVFAVLAPLRDELGVITHHINVSHDISEQKLMQRALELERDRAEAATIAKSQFLANMSHEIRTPMNGVIGLTELTLETDLDDNQRDYLNAVRNSALSLMDLLNDVLDFSKIEAGKLDTESVDFSLKSMMNECRTFFSARAQKKGVHFECEVPTDLPEPFRGDPNRLRQVLNNLCDNALKFTSDGSVRLAVHCQALDDAHYEVRFSVVDTGIGISDGQKQAVFEAFNQGDASTTRQYGGTGLGLAICARLVELMGGRIWLDSSPGQGTSFFFTVRLGKVGGPSNAQTTLVVSFEQDAVLPTASETKVLKVLVVEDNKVNQLLALTLLKRWGHSVELAENGLQAVEKLTQFNWDIVLMDLQMPIMGGLDAARQIRASETKGRHVPIIAVTANAMEADRSACLEAGMDDFLPKPLRADALQALLTKYCG
jgi:PAS domain S-box-containing protein